jgi:hypothetical protein
MLREQFRIEETWSTGKRWSIDTGFLQSAFKNFKFPVIESFNLRFFGSVTTLDTGSIENFAHVNVIGQNFKFKDERDDRIDCSMRGLRIFAQQELGARLVDRADLAPGATTTTTTYDVSLPIPFHTERAERPNDYLVTVEEFLDSELIWNAATTNPVTASTVINSGTLQFQVNVRENWTRDQPSRLQIREVSSEKLEETFTVDGALRYALLYAYSSGQDLTSLSTYTEVDSRTLRLSDMPTTALVQIAQLNQRDIDSTNDEVTRQRVIPLCVPDFDQHMSSLVEHGKLHLRLQAALPTGGKLLTVTVTDRAMRQVAKNLGYASEGQLQTAIEAGEIEVVGAKGAKPLNAMGIGAARKFPWRRRAA